MAVFPKSKYASCYFCGYKEQKLHEKVKNMVIMTIKSCNEFYELGS